VSPWPRRSRAALQGSGSALEGARAPSRDMKPPVTPRARPREQRCAHWGAFQAGRGTVTGLSGRIPSGCTCTRSLWLPSDSSTLSRVVSFISPSGFSLPKCSTAARMFDRYSERREVGSVRRAKSTGRGSEPAATMREVDSAMRELWNSNSKTLLRWCVRAVVYGPRGKVLRRSSEESAQATRSLLLISVYFGDVGATGAAIATRAEERIPRRAQPSTVRSHRKAWTAAQ